jgi:hypothetical protein
MDKVEHRWTPRGHSDGVVGQSGYRRGSKVDLTARDGFPEPLTSVRTAAPTTCRGRRARAVHVARVRRLLPRRPCARALAARPSALRLRWLRSRMISAAQGSRQSKRSMPNRRSRATKRPSPEQLLRPPDRRYRVRPSRTDRPRRLQTVRRIERERPVRNIGTGSGAKPVWSRPCDVRRPAVGAIRG